MKVTGSSAGLEDARQRAEAHSPFLRDLLGRMPDIADRLESHGLAAALAAARRADDGDPMRALRQERYGHALALGLADLAGLVPLEETMRHLSDLADRALERALAAAMAARTPGAEPRGFAIVALGKLGGRELNYSSDVDLIFLYDPATLPLRDREDPGQAAVRIGQRVIETLQKRTEDGYAFRVDLRLRPSPEVTPIALPVEGAISYYESAALPWERAAFVRARLCAGDPRLGADFLAALHPFVWRRSLDFGTIGEIRSISSRIRDHYAQGQALGPGFDVKRGRGGIREIEFFTQIHQLIHGGREPSLRCPATLDALPALAAGGWIGAEEAADLVVAYRQLRTVEHRLQMVDDRQTHELPRDSSALDNVARLDGAGDAAVLLERIRPHVQRVGALYDTLGAGGERRLPQDPQALEVALAEAGHADTRAARQRIERWRTGRARSLRTSAAREAFEAMLPALVEALAASPDPVRAMNRFDDIVERLPSGLNFYRLLEARPVMVQHLGAILSHAPALAEQLGRRPELLDGLIDATAYEPARPVPDLAARFAASDRAAEDYQMLLDRVRRRVNEARFALGAQLILALSDPLEVARGYARIAEAAIEVLAGAAVAEFERAHGRVPGSELLVLGLGRLGGGALTHASDLDLIYLFSGTHEAESDGPRPLRATDYFNRLAPRVTAALSVPTAAGPLYEVDTRLRPSGTDGLLAISEGSFADYQRSHAWTFEHMALTRARPVYGSAPARARLAGIVDGLLRIGRDPAKVAADAARMRAEVARHKPPRGPFDIKLGPGGLVDLEFAVQTLQLTHREGLVPRFDEALDALNAAGLIPPEIAGAHRLLARMLIAFRLVSPQSGEPPEASRPLVARACAAADWPALLAEHERARQSISALWRAVAAGQGG